MYALYAVFGQQGMEYRYVAEPYKPFGIVTQRKRIKLLQDMHSPIAAARTHYSLNLRIKKRLTEVGITRLLSAGIRAVMIIGMVADHRHPALLLQYRERRLDILGIYRPAGRHYGYLVALLKRGRSYDGHDY